MRYLSFAFAFVAVLGLASQASAHGRNQMLYVMGYEFNNDHWHPHPYMYGPPMEDVVLVNDRYPY